MIPGIGLSEIIVIFVVLLLVVGPHKIPEVARNIGRMISRLKQASYEFKRALYLDEIRDEVYQPVKDLNPTQEVKQFIDQVAQDTFSPDSSSPSSSTPSSSGSSQLQDPHSIDSTNDQSYDEYLNDDQHEDHLDHHPLDPNEYHATPFSTAISHSQQSTLKQLDTQSQQDQSQRMIGDEEDDFEESIPSLDPLMAHIHTQPTNETQADQNIHDADLDHAVNSEGDSV